MGKPSRQRGVSLGEIEALYRGSFRRLLRVAAMIVEDRDAARDVVQDAFAQAVRSRSSYRGDGVVEAWLWRIVVNTARSYRRTSLPPLQALLEGEPISNGAGEIEDSALRTAIAALPERQRLAVFLRYYADLDYATIAEALGVRPGTVAASLNAAHASLRRLLEGVHL